MSHTKSIGTVTAENRRGFTSDTVKLWSLFLIIFFISNVRRLHVQTHMLKMFKEMWTSQLVRRTFIKGGRVETDHFVLQCFSNFEYL